MIFLSFARPTSSFAAPAVSKYRNDKNKCEIMYMDRCRKHSMNSHNNNRVYNQLTYERETDSSYVLFRL